MRNVWAIYKRELGVYFHSPMAYAVIFIFTLLSGWFFYSSTAAYALQSMFAARNPMAQGINATDLVITPMCISLGIVLLMMVPILTMRLFAEEKKSGSFELLLSYPVRDVEVLLGKYFSAMTVFLLMTALTVLYPVHLRALGVGEPGVTASGYLGLVLLGAAFLALGVFISSLTENQIVAAAVSFGISIFIWVLYAAVQFLQPPWNDILGYLSMVSHLANFAQGIIDTADVAYYLLFTFFFLFLTLRGLESKRWRG